MPTRSTKPGHPVRGSTSGRPLMAALDLFGRRWMLRVMWELRDGPAGFRDLLTRCEGISNAVLSTRLSELVQSRLIARTHDRAYVLTDLGREVCRAIAPLDAWSRRWAAELDRTTVSRAGRIPSTTRGSPG